MGASVQDQQPESTQAESSPQPQPESRISKAQAKELFRSVDVILKFASQDTGLPIKSEVKRHLITRESMEKYVDKRMKDDKDTQRLEQSRLVLEKFGLLPPGYDLHHEFLRLLSEQVAAYYDPKTRSVNLLDWVPPDTQKPVLAHELTHALQDQKIGLEKWELAGAKDDKPLPDPQEYVVEEAQAARQCVAEGQAMVVLIDYTLAPMGKDVPFGARRCQCHACGNGRHQRLAGVYRRAHVPARVVDDALYLGHGLRTCGAHQEGEGRGLCRHAGKSSGGHAADHAARDLPGEPGGAAANHPGSRQTGRAWLRTLRLRGNGRV